MNLKMVLKVILDVRQEIKMEKKSEEKKLPRNYILDSRHFSTNTWKTKNKHLREQC